MCSKYNRLLLSTCVQILAFGALTSLPAHAEFKWTPPDEPEYVEDMGPDVFMVGDEAASMGSGSALPEYYDTPHVENNQAIEIEPPIEIIVLEDNIDQYVEEKPIEIKTISLTNRNKEPVLAMPAPVQNESTGEPASLSLVLNPYPLESGNPPPVEEGASLDSQKEAPEVRLNEDVAYEVIEGFGMEMPMALALSQIVPPEYAYSFSKGINPGMRLSWEGGKAWDIVLNDALAPFGIEASIYGKKVILRPDGSTPKPKLTAVSPAIQETPVEIIEETPEQAMSASLKEEPVKKKVETPAASDSVILDKTSASADMPSEDDSASTLVEDLMQPLDSFKDGKYTASELGISVVESSPMEAPAFKPEIILDEEEKAEEEYAKKLEETHPFDDTSEQEGLLPISDSPAMDEAIEATGEPMSIPFEEDVSFSDDTTALLEEEPTQASDIIDEELILPSTEEMDELEQFSHFRNVPSNKIRIWQAKRNANLQKILEEWSTKERVPLTWNATEKYSLDYDVFISGTYQNAINILFKKGLKRAPEYALSEAPYSLSVQKDED